MGEGRHTEMSEPMFTLPLADYELLISHAQTSDMIVECEVCGAWLDRDEEAYASTEDFTGCWKAATRDGKWDHLCKSYRATR
jgi:hypothetical protein